MRASFPPRSGRHAAAALSLILAPGAPAAPPSPPPAPDPIEGAWLGEVGFDLDRVRIGLEFRRDPEGRLACTLCQPVLNLYAAPIAGAVQRDAAHYTIDQIGLDVTLSGDDLTGTLTGLKEPLTLHRAAQLPVEPPMPALPAGPAPRWQVRLGGSIYAPVAARDGIAYIGTTAGVLNAVNISDGSIAWAFPAGRPIHGEALPTPDAVYFACDDGFLYRLDRSTGKQVWRYDLGDGAVPRILPHPAVFEYDYRSPRPALSGGVLYIGSADGGFHAIGESDGARRWRFDAKGKVRADAAVQADRIYLGTMENTLYSLRTADGSVIWTKDLKAPITSNPTLSGGSLLVGTRGSVFYSLNPDTAEVAWKQIFWGSWVESSPIPAGDRLYIGSSDLRRAACYDPGTGRVIWRTDVYGYPWGRPCVTDDAVFIAAGGTSGYMIRHTGGLLKLARDDGRVLWRWAAPEAPEALQNGFAAGPVLDSGILLVGAINGTLYAFPAG